MCALHTQTSAPPTNPALCGAALSRAARLLATSPSPTPVPRSRRTHLLRLAEFHARVALEAARVLCPGRIDIACAAAGECAAVYSGLVLSYGPSHSISPSNGHSSTTTTTTTATSSSSSGSDSRSAVFYSLAQVTHDLAGRLREALRRWEGGWLSGGSLSGVSGGGATPTPTPAPAAATGGGGKGAGGAPSASPSNPVSTTSLLPSLPLHLQRELEVFSSRARSLSELECRALARGTGVTNLEFESVTALGGGGIPPPPPPPPPPPRPLL